MPLVNVSFTDIQAIDSVGVPPLPIPNREVKPNSADGTAKICGRVGHRRFYKEEFFQKSSSFFVLCSSLSWWRATILTAPLPEGSCHEVTEGREYIAQLSSYVGAHRCVRPTNAREFHSGRHTCAPKTQAMKNGQTHRSAPTLFALRCLCSSPPSLRFACATSSSQRGSVLYIWWFSRFLFLGAHIGAPLQFVAVVFFKLSRFLKREYP